MTPQEFQTELNRLSNVYGGNAYKTERAQIIWKEMGNLSNDSFKRIVDKLIGECRQAPMIQDFRDASAPDREREHNENKRKRENVFSMQVRRENGCRSCHDIGVVMARRKDDKTPWAFKCSCSIGRSGGRNYPEWENGYLKEMDVV